MKTFLQNLKSLRIAVLVFVLSRAATAFANPTGLTVISGSASVQQSGSQLNVTAGQFTVLNWQSFNIQKGETTTFLQPSSSAIVFNLIGSANPSQIFGSLNANGTVILANANGFYFGPDSMIKVGGSFIATTASLPLDLGSGATWQFSGPPPLASIVNYGQIEAGTGKSLYLIAEKIENHGSLTALQGDVQLAAGDDVLVSESADGRGLSATVTMPEGSVDNFGRITADAGTIALQAKVVNQDGILQADSIAEKNGEIELVAADSLNLGADSNIAANGDASAAGSAGGDITLKSANAFSDVSGSEITVTGGSQGGNGGAVEISAPVMSAINSTIDGHAQVGSTGGSLLLDPDYIVIDQTDASPDGKLHLNVNSDFVGLSTINLQAQYDISFADGIAWDLSGSTGQSSGQLTLEAGGNIIFGSGTALTDENNWSVSLYAGVTDFANKVISPGTGNIYLNGGSGLNAGGSIELAAGDINLYAGQSILVAPLGSQVVSGSIFTTGGGNIFAYAAAGDIVAGTSNGSRNGNTQTTDYNFTTSGATPYPYLGGISTAAGGNVTLIAGDDVDSTPIVPSRQAPGASGTYGAGAVTVIAGNNITGNYTLADGIGTLIAGVQVSGSQAATLQNPNANASAYAATLAGLATSVEQSPNANGNIGLTQNQSGPATINPVTLGLIDGSWNVWAANNLYLKQVINPNGAFNNSSRPFLYNYAPDAAVNLWADNAIELVGGSYGSAASSVKQTPIYAPTLSLDAGAGGIQIDQSIVLAPSSAGLLSIITRDGGNLTAAVPAGSTDLNGIIMSDSSSPNYATFKTEHDNIHLDDPNVQNNPNFQPVYLDISGSIGSFSLTVPTFADITVEGTKPFVDPDGNNVYGTYNFGFQGRNLSASQTTTIKVMGTVAYRGDSTAIDLTTAQLADPLPAALFSDSADKSVTSNLIFDAATGQLIYVGVMSPTDLSFLLAPQVLVLDKNGNPVLQVAVDGEGNPILDGNGNPTYVPETKTLTLDSTQQAMILQLDTASQSASLGDNGLALTGPGNFTVNANTIDLGVSGGIHVTAPDATMAELSPLGAELNVTTVGDLDMTATKISNESYLGGINVQVGGALNVGGEFTTLGDPSEPKGIYTTSGGNVSVTAQGDLNVNGSRIAAYDGGSITVESMNGNVNAGVGGAGYVTLGALELVGGSLVSIPASMPGSGILATTVPGGQATLGNILVETPNGIISSSQGGIVQISFNATDDSKAIAMALAGYELRDATGANRLTAANFMPGDTASDLADVSSSFSLLDKAGDTVGKIAYVSPGRAIDATGSGIIAENIIAKATGKVSGLFVGLTVNVTTPVIGPITVFSSSPPVITDGGGKDPTPTDSGAPPVIFTADSTTAAAPTAPAKTVAEAADSADSAAAKTDNSDNDFDGDAKKKGKGIALAEKVSRVTVLLPRKN
jgi:filamentous hemagglutinin family protein